MLLHQVSESKENLPSFPPSHPPPGAAFKGVPRGSYGQIHVYLVGGGNFGDPFFGARVDSLEGIAGDGVGELGEAREGGRRKGGREGVREEKVNSERATCIQPAFPSLGIANEGSASRGEREGLGLEGEADTYQYHAHGMQLSTRGTSLPHSTDYSNPPNTQIYPPTLPSMRSCVTFGWCVGVMGAAC